MLDNYKETIEFLIVDLTDKKDLLNLENKKALSSLIKLYELLDTQKDMFECWEFVAPNDDGFDTLDMLFFDDRTPSPEQVLNVIKKVKDGTITEITRILKVEVREKVVF